MDESRLANVELELTAADLAMSRVADSTATRADWDALVLAARSSPRIWEDLAVTIRQSQQLAAEVRNATQDAVASHLPPLEAPSPRSSRPLSHRRLVPYGGWIAAALMVAAIGRWGSMTPRGLERTSAASLSSPMEYLSNYLTTGRKEGTVVGEMPRKLLLDMTPTEDGKGAYVLFVRQIVERVKVDDLYRISVDELGDPTPVRLQAAEWDGGRVKSPM